MAISMFRCDDRLLHGQVAFSWVNNSSPKVLLICNDELMQDPLMQGTLQLAKPAGVKLALKSVDDGIALLNNPKAAGTKIFLVVKNTKDVVRICKGTGLTFDSLNVGGLHIPSEGCYEVMNGVYLSQEDIANLKTVKDQIKEFDSRKVPTDSKRDLTKVI